ncbi:ATP-binding protein [Streptomyces sp. 13-12-16]|uniref:ATP-binding protein n=1 Tax=Streptomyces sp. 13-12-16 TaxID=1570823 RepID=UPI000A1F95B2|nr:ATP-binding protein [Streptomyces sp. 13-12-16]OSP43165.1 ATP-binding protein [Streptomyces sp. 13-12-16]
MPGTDIKDRQRRCVLPFEALPAEVRLLRRAAATQLGQWGVPTAGDATQLVVTELATNVIKHVGEGSPATLILEWKRERLRVEMHDKSSALPALRTADCEAECGRGLHMLAAMAVDWGTAVTALGKAVWCEIELGSDAVCLRMERAIDALESYRERGGSVLHGRCETVLEETAVELIADLLHWTSARGLDPDDVLDRAQMHYEAEADVAA